MLLHNLKWELNENELSEEWDDNKSLSRVFLCSNSELDCYTATYHSMFAKFQGESLAEQFRPFISASALAEIG